MKAGIRVIGTGIMLASVVGVIFSQQEDKKTPSKPNPPKVIVPSRDEREKPKANPPSNSNTNRNGRPR